MKYGDIVIVNPREIHRTFQLDDSEYERILIHVSDSMLKDLSTAQTNLLNVFHKNKAHFLHFSEEEMDRFTHDHMQMRNLWKKKEYGADLLCSAWFQITDSDFTANAFGRRFWCMGERGRLCW